MTPEQEFLIKKVDQRVKTAGLINNRLTRSLLGAATGSLGGATLGVGAGLLTGGSALPIIAGGAALGGLGGGFRGLLTGSRSGTLSRLAKDMSTIPDLAVRSTASLSPTAYGFAPAIPIAGGAGLGYVLSDDDHKLRGALLGAGGGAAFRYLTRPRG